MTSSGAVASSRAQGAGAGEPLLTLEGISKSFPGVKALTNVDLELRAGRGHALVGENGAGKSTLIKIMSGIVTPDEGRIVLDGREMHLRSPAEARRHGISLVPQEISLVPWLSVAENIFMGQLPRRGPQVRRGGLIRDSRAVLERLGLSIDPRSDLGAHGPAVQQLVMIARGIALNGRLFILDEPTASLTDPEIERLFAVVRELKADGAALVYVSHRLPELEHVADDITVLRDGAVVGRMLTEGTTEDQLVRAMIGRSIERFFDTQADRKVQREVLLSARGLSRGGMFEDVTLDLHAGEVAGLAGLVGAGRTEVAQAIFGVDRLDSGELEVTGKPVRIRSPRGAINAGLALVPEERKAQGLVLDASISDNIVLPRLAELATAGFFRESRLRAYSRRISAAVRVRAPNVTTPVRSLSGGNQQKVVLGRWLTEKPKIYILDEPTRGIDIGAKSEIYQQIGALAGAGAAVLVISSELPELLGICDRILVMRAGRLVGELDAATATEESVLELAMGTGNQRLRLPLPLSEVLLAPADAESFDARTTAPVLGPVSGAQISLPYGHVLSLPDGSVGDPDRSYSFLFSQALTGSTWAEAEAESAMIEAARHPNVQVTYSNTDNDPLQQVEDLAAAAARGVDAVLVWPHSVGPLTPQVEQMTKDGVAVVGMERTVATREYTSWLYLDNAKATADLAEAVGRHVNGVGTVVETDGTIGSSPQILRRAGFVNTLHERYPSITVEFTEPTDYTVAQGYEVAAGYLRAHPDQRIDAWYAHYSEIAVGVQQALREHQRTDIPVFTIGDGEAAVRHVLDGTFFAMAPWTPLHGDVALRAAIYHATGQDAPRNIILAQPPLITADNAAEFLQHTWPG